MDTADIIRQIHDSEINGAVEWFFDGQWRWRLGDRLNGWKAEGNAASLDAAVQELAEAAFSEFPRSTFAAWWSAQKRNAAT